MGCIDLIRSDIRFLGVNGSKSESGGTISLQVSFDTVIDGGNLISSLKKEVKFIENIFLTHSHLDHIADIPYLFDQNFEFLKKPIKIYALPESIDFLKENIFNDKIWPDFSKIKLFNSDKFALEYKEIEYNKTYEFKDVALTPIKVNHTIESCGYIIQKRDFTTLFVPDTAPCQNIIDTLNQKEIDSLIIDCSYPARMELLAKQSGHFSTSLLKSELQKIKKDIDVYLIHLKSNYKEEIEKEAKDFGLLKGKGRIVEEGEFFQNPDIKAYEEERIDFIKLVAKEKDLDTILKTILIEAMKITRSDGGTIYIKEKNSLKFKTVVNQKLNIFTSDITWPNVPLYIDGKENLSNVSAVCALKNEIINIDDVYEAKEYNFEGTRAFDKKNGYRSKSMLLIPLTDVDDEVIGVLQLINKNNFLNIESYTKKDEKEIKSLAVFAATAISKNALIENLENLFLSFIQTISFAINKKSKYGYRHIKNVAKLIKLMIFAVNRDNTIFKDKYYSKEEQKELEISALVHDIGKIVTPDYILDKSTRLEGLYDRISEIKERFINAINSIRIEELKLELAVLKGEVDVDIDATKKAYTKVINSLVDDFNFIKSINSPQKTLSDEDIKRVEEISKKQFKSDFGKIELLTKDEVEKLSVKEGNLTKKEKEKIREHAKVGYEMLSHLNFPKKYEKIPQIAGFHHEKLNGKGYPFGLTKKELSMESRMMAICDKFEALTSSDRPYKRAKSKDEAFAIMDKMADNGEIDKELFEFFKQSGIFDTYIEESTISSDMEFLEIA